MKHFPVYLYTKDLSISKTKGYATKIILTGVATAIVHLQLLSWILFLKRKTSMYKQLVNWIKPFLCKNIPSTEHFITIKAKNAKKRTLYLAVHTK